MLLGIGVNTLRRRITAGQIRAEQIERPQGHVWRVYLDIAPPSNDPTVQDAKQEAVGGSQQPPAQLAQAEAISTLVQTTVAAVMGPLVAEVAASRQSIERQAGEIADLREQRGRHAAELERAASTILALGEENAALKASQTPQGANPGLVVPVATTDGPATVTARLRALAPWLLAVLAIVAVVALLVVR